MFVALFKMALKDEGCRPFYQIIHMKVFIWMPRQ